MRQVEFGDILLLTDQPPIADADPAISWIQIDRIESRTDYSRFMLRDLPRYITTGHALCIQWDGFVLNGGAWDQRFLEYDYIGAPWPHFRDGHNVGNGGFSLRSRRLLDACKDLPFDGSEAEDLVISRLYRNGLEGRGICFAPPEVARNFAYERMPPTGREFGFHGAFNLVRQLSAGAAVRLFRSLEPGMLTSNERWELLRWALIHGQVRLALAMLRRLARESFI